MGRDYNRSFLHCIRVRNFGCIGTEGIEVSLDEIVCLVGPNNCGKSTVLRAYEAAVNLEKLDPTVFCARRNNAPVEVELDIHIPTGTPNINEDWKLISGDLKLVRSKWTWTDPGVAPVRATWDKDSNGWSTEGKAAGIDQVFSSRLPRPFRIEALGGPEEEHKKLLKLIIDPIAIELKKLLENEEAEVSTKRREFMTAARQPVANFNKVVQKAQEAMSKSYSRVFTSSSLKLQIDVAEMKFDATSALIEGSSLKFTEHAADFGLKQQGTGSQRAIFWSMLEVRSALQKEIDSAKGIAERKAKVQKELEKLKAKELKMSTAKEKNAQEIETKTKELEALNHPEADDISLPGYMLLIDEPEIALHPNAVRSAKSHLYQLAREAGWQVMLTTHCPGFIDPTEDHTTIVRLTRSVADPAPHLFRSDDAEFSNDEKALLRFLLQFDPTVAELFFGSYPIIVEGDTELAAFLALIQSKPEDYPEINRPTVIRAAGKALILPLIKILRHFKIPFSILHDADMPKKGDGTANGMWTENWKIFQAISECRAAGIRVVHRVSIPDFERQLGFAEGGARKPLEMWNGLNAQADKMLTWKGLLEELASAGAPESEHPTATYKDSLTSAVVDWGSKNANGDARFVV